MLDRLALTAPERFAFTPNFGISCCDFVYAMARRRLCLGYVLNQ